MPQGISYYRRQEHLHLPGKIKENNYNVCFFIAMDFLYQVGIIKNSIRSLKIFLTIRF